jgi:hypothetical protein
MQEMTVGEIENVSGGTLTADETAMLAHISDPNQRAMTAAQLRMQHAQEILSFISNILKKKNEMAMAIIV